ncbi:MAG: methylmalonyl-CoA mutase family protein [Alphaproteobacteria bacterium]|nr:methylmalonyl-CoA mutase family protein [Alphaproteobacteria bacterium]
MDDTSVTERVRAKASGSGSAPRRAKKGAAKAAKGYRVSNHLRFVTATSLFDGHDAAINVMRRVMQAAGAEVIHLGHNRSVDEIVTAAIDEDAQGIAVSSYQGGHIEFFQYMVDLLAERGAGQIKVFGGGGGVIVPEEIEALHGYGVARIYSPVDGQRLGLKGMIEDLLKRADIDFSAKQPKSLVKLKAGDRGTLARVITGLEAGTAPKKLVREIEALAAKRGGVPVVGITGTGGAGKSSLTDELIRRFRTDRPELDIALIAVDPSKRKSGGALLGDRIRMNAIGPMSGGGRVYMRSLATRGSGSELAACLPGAVQAAKAAGHDLVLVETSGIGQGDAEIVPYVDLSIYAMTPEYGAASQLEKIDMLDFADLVAINKFDRKGADDARRDVAKQYQRNHERFETPVAEMPVYGTIASKFNDDGVTALYHAIRGALAERGFAAWESRLPVPATSTSSRRDLIVPADRRSYLGEVARCVRAYKATAKEKAAAARARRQLLASKEMLAGDGAPKAQLGRLEKLAAEREAEIGTQELALLEAWPKTREAYSGDELVSRVRGRELRTRLTSTTICGTELPKIALPRFEEDGELLHWLMLENLPGHFPYTAGVFPFKREGEDPTRMFAGEGDPFRTNRRFKFVSKDSDAKRLSTAFDSVTLYGNDPDERPDIYGKVGNSGVSIATLDDMKVLFDGFDLCQPTTSVSMTINGPAPTILAMFLNTAIDQRLDAFRDDKGREPTAKEAKRIVKWVHENVRGTVQADILKEDQGQNTCLFSTEFSLKVMGDIQAYFVEHDVENFYSVSISGYHIAEAGANPISQLAFTLANGFTYVESYLARGMNIDDFAPNLSFFFSAGMDPEYSVLGRVARRIWAVAMRELYGGDARSQKLKYHSQTSGRSLHAQEFAFNDIRTTLQALIASYENTNSLHTNAYDEAITTPSEESVRRAMAIQLIIGREWGLAKNHNPNQGSFIIEQLTELVEEAVLAEFERINDRGGVLGAMETGYQRGKIQDESLHYETLKHDGSYPIVGVNTFINPAGPGEETTLELARSTEKEKRSQLKRLRAFQRRHGGEAPAMLERLQAAARNDDNVFAVLMQAVRCCSLGQITNALFEVGGQYRRNM